MAGSEQHIEIPESFLESLLTVRPEYSGLDFPDFGKVQSRTDWTDDKMLCYPGLKLELWEDSFIVTNGETIISRLHSEISNITIGHTMNLAFNLRSTGSRNPIFSQGDFLPHTDDIPVERLDGTYVTRVGDTKELNSYADNSIKAVALCYIAASLLRLFTKSADNYINARGKIIEDFQKFYGRSFPYPSIQFPSLALETIKERFSMTPEFKGTLKTFLYHHHAKQNDSGLRRYLYEQHLEYTGMHSYSLFSSVRKKISVSPGTLVSLLSLRATEDAVGEIETVLTDYDADIVHPTKVRRSWKYARIFNPEYFCNLQTKNCVELVAILAHLAQKCGAQDGNAGDVLNITHLRRRKDIHTYEQVATRIYNHITGMHTQGN